MTFTPGPHCLDNRDYESLTGDCPICGPGVPMTTKGRCRKQVREREKAAGRTSSRRGKGSKATYYEMSDGRVFRLPAGLAHDVKQGEVCNICGSDSKLVLDHCHETGKFRGLLCRRCNIMLGLLGDDLAGAMKVVDYLSDKHESTLHEKITQELHKRSQTIQYKRQ